MDELKPFAEKFTSENGIEHYTINIEGEVSKDENYLGEVIFFYISPKHGHSFHFIRKRYKQPEDYNEKTAIKVASHREFYVYSKVFPAFREFLKKNNQESTLDFIPKIYSIEEDDTHSLMILQNMKYAGYQMLDKKFVMDHEKVGLVLETYAKFHSMSLAMRELEPANFKSLTEGMTDIWSYFKTVFNIKNYFGPLIRDVLKIVGEKGRSDLIAKYKPIEEDIENLAYVKLDEEEKLVICHGDAWNNNMMFKHEEGYPKSVCLIDFQVSSLSNPVLDLFQFLFSAGDKDVLENIEDYLKLYHDKLSENLKNFGVDIKRVYSFEKLMEHWKKLSKTGLVLGICTIQICLADANEMPDDIKDLTFSDSTKIKNSKMFSERMSELLITFGDKFM